MPQAQREILLDAYVEEQSLDETGARHGITVKTRDNHRKAVSGKLRESLMTVVDSSADVDFPDWYDRVEEMN
jgi:DNA-directed RNA polymerase specialized sigma24 family protein